MPLCSLGTDVRFLPGLLRVLCSSSIRQLGFCDPRCVCALRGIRSLGRYVAGLCPGVALLLLYDALAFGSPFHLSYRYVAIKQQASGFFGIGPPHLHSAYEVLVGSSGLLLISPVLIAAAYGLVVLARTHPVEAAVCGAVTVFFLLLNSGYYLPYGGTLLGPRFFVPALPFLALGLGPAFARRPRLTGALTVLSVVPVIGLMIVASKNPPIHNTIWGTVPSAVEVGSRV